VAVIGLGAIGQVAAQMAKRAGAAYVAVIDPIEKRRDAALSAGADEALDPVNDDAGLALKTATGKRGVDVIIETSASLHALQAALRGIAYGGTIAYVGWARPFGAGLDLGREAHFNNATIVFSRSCSYPNRENPRWTEPRIQETCWRMLAEGALDCEAIIDPVVPFAESASAYEEFVDQHPDRSIKMGIVF
jgi:threonine dehydrogenase-like Zn-dependent dehydrogenase